MAEPLNLDPDILRRVMMNQNASQSMLLVQRQAAIEQLTANEERLTTELADASQQRDMFQARATELAAERDALRERLNEYEPDAQVIDLETPESDKATG